MEMKSGVKSFAARPPGERERDESVLCKSGTHLFTQLLLMVPCIEAEVMVVRTGQGKLASIRLCCALLMSSYPGQ